MAHNNEDPPWLRPHPILVLPANTDDKSEIQASIVSAPAPRAVSSPTLFPPTTRSSAMTPTPPLLPPTHTTTGGTTLSNTPGNEEQYVGWRPQQTSIQRIAHSPPLSPLDLAMYPGAPILSDPAAARRAVAGLKPLRILSSRRPGGPVSAGPSRRPSVEVMNSTFTGFMGFFSSAKRASVAAVADPSSSSSSRASTQSQSTPVSHPPIPVSPLPPPRTPPLVPRMSLAPDLVNQMEPELRAHLEALAALATGNHSLSSSLSSSHPTSTSQPIRNGPPDPPDPPEEEEMVLEVRDLDAGRVIKITDLDAVVSSDGVNRKSQSTSQRPPSISEFMVVRDLDAQPRTSPPPRLQQQSNRISEPAPLTPPRFLNPAQFQPESPLLPAFDPHQTQESPITPLTEAVYVNRSLETSLSKLENILYGARNNLSGSPSSISTSSSNLSSRRDELPRARVRSPSRTARTSSSHVSSMFSSRMSDTPLTTPPASPPPLPRTKPVTLPCIVCGRPMQNMTSTRCGHVFCRCCIEGRSLCPVCKSSIAGSDLRAIFLFV